MKLKVRILIISIIFIILFCINVSAQEDGFGVGAIIDSSLGVSLKYWLEKDTAISAAVGLPFNNSVYLHADYLIHLHNVIQVKKGTLPLYYGIGGRFKQKKGKREDKIILGARTPLGMNYIFEQYSVDLFIEVVPIIDIVPQIDLNLSVALGGRYFF